MIKLLKRIFSINTISRRMRVAFMCILLLLFFSGAMSLLELERVSHDTEEILLANKENTELAEKMRKALEEQNDIMITLVVSDVNPTDIQKYTDLCSTSIATLSGLVDTAEQKMQSADSPEDADNPLRTSIVRVNSISRAYIQENIVYILTNQKVEEEETSETDELAVTPEILPEMTTEPHEWYLEKYKPAYVEAQNQISAFATGAQDSLGPEVNNLSHTARRAVTPVFISLVVMVVIVIMFYFFMRHYFVRPILRINRSLGDFITYKKPFDGEIPCRDEIATLRDRIAQLATKLTK